LICIVITLWLRRRGQSQTQNTHIKGSMIDTTKNVTRKIKQRRQDSSIKIANVPIILDTERSHFFIRGTTGTGKSQLFSQFLTQIRERGERAVIYDKGCHYVKNFYRPDKDIILNPLDQRCPPWHVWAECADSADYDSLAQALIPTPNYSSDPFWNNAARMLFASTAYQLSKDKNRSMSGLLSALLTADLSEMTRLLKGTEAASLVSEKIEKTAVTIRAVIATMLKSLKYVKDADNVFSIREWINQENTDSCLFVTSTMDKHATLKPLISMWLDIATRALMSLDEDPERRIWLLFDELPTLHKLPCLIPTLAESRKYGACTIVGMQSYAQLRQSYGVDDAEVIRGLCNTSVFLRTPAGRTADWVAHELGDTEIHDMREGISYGANTIRDGISLNHQRIRRPLVIGSEITALDNLSGYLKLPGNFPICKIHFPYKDYPSLEVGFTPQRFEGNTFQHLSTLIEDCIQDLPLHVKTSTQDDKMKETKQKKCEDFDITQF